MGYRPKVVLARIKTENSESKAKRLLNGLEIRLGLWSYLDKENYHLHDWDKETDEKIMEVMFLAEVEAGFRSEESKEEFIEEWKSGEWEPEASYVFTPEEAEIIEIIHEEKDD